MSQEIFKPYQERVATVVGGNGALGSKITTSLKGLDFRSVQICEKGDPFLDFVRGSTDLFFAVDDTEISAMLQASRDHLRPGHSILDGASVKKPLIPIYKQLDQQGISIVSTHLGAVPSQPWRGIKVWVCKVGPNSERAKQLASDLFKLTNSHIRFIDITDHENVEKDQWFTMTIGHIFAAALRSAGYSLGEFDLHATLSSELQGVSVARILGQGTKVPGEIISHQLNKAEFMKAIQQAVKELEAVLGDGPGLQRWMQTNIDSHNADGTVKYLYLKGGIIGARNANLRMHSLSFRITDDQPGMLRRMLEPFYAEGANITAIDSMPGTISDEERARGVNPDKIVDFDIGIDPKTINPDIEQKIRKRLTELGCSIRE